MGITPKRINNKWLIGAFILASLIISTAVLLSASSKSDKVTIPSSNPLQSNSSSSSQQSNSGNVQTTQGSGSASANSGAASTGPAPATPSGNFVSNHHPGGSAPTSEASACNTTPGAVCYIQFTKGSDAKKLDPRTANGDGSVLWYWDINQAGLSSGTWSITAVATLNGQTTSSNDAMPLEVQ